MGICFFNKYPGFVVDINTRTAHCKQFPFGLNPNLYIAEPFKNRNRLRKIGMQPFRTDTVKILPDSNEGSVCLIGVFSLATTFSYLFSFTRGILQFTDSIFPVQPGILTILIEYSRLSLLFRFEISFGNYLR